MVVLSRAGFRRRRCLKIVFSGLGVQGSLWAQKFAADDLAIACYNQGTARFYYQHTCAPFFKFGFDLGTSASLFLNGLNSGSIAQCQNHRLKNVDSTEIAVHCHLEKEGSGSYPFQLGLLLGENLGSGLGLY